MRRWTRAPFLTRCSYNGCSIYQGQPMQVLTFTDGPKQFQNKAEFRYCMDHAQGQPPPDLPMDDAPKQLRTKRMTSILGTGAMIRAELARRLGRGE